LQQSGEDADKIADHATDRDSPEELGFESQEELARYIENVLDGNVPVETSEPLRGGRTGYHDPETGLTIVHDPASPHKRTIFNDPGGGQFANLR
jgi:hypothetical protein